MLRAYCLLWLNVGFSFLPLVPNSKKPLFSWEKYQQEHPTEEDRQSWFSKGSNNLGVITGGISQGLSVQDFETKEGFMEFYGEDKIPEVFKQTLVVGTPHGGVHVYYRSLQPCRRSIRISQDPPLDLLGEGGYVVSPPSIIDHDLCSKGKCKKEGLGSYEPLSNHCKVMGVKDLFGSTRERCKALGWKTNGSSSKKFDPRVARQGAEEGSRNEKLFRYALHMINVERLWPQEAWDALIRANSKCRPPLPEKELQTIFSSACKYDSHNRTERVQNLWSELG